MNKIAIKVSQVAKEFILPHEKQTSVKSAFINSMRGSKRSFERQKVLNNISFDIKEGEFFGIVGRNGSGKSTLLKMIAGIYEPTSGSIEVNGLLTPFIELGVGFNPELTGRENVYLNGALLGFNRKEMTAMYDDIVAFAELEKFMDQKLKNYSSGMQVRLAFSIAIRAKSDILVLDEVLAVGDEAFQSKCFKIFEDYKASSKTVILVTHDMATVKKFCSRALLLKDGAIVEIGDPNKISLAYTALNEGKVLEDIFKENSRKNTAKIKLQNNKIISNGEKLSLSIDWSSLKGVRNIGVAVFKKSGEYVFGANSILDKVKVPASKRLVYEVESPLSPGNYYFKIGFFGDSDRDIISFIDEGPQFIVGGNNKWEGLMYLEHKWKEA